MTDDTTGDKPKTPKKSNVKPLHKGIKVETEEKKVVIDEELLSEVTRILKGVMSGEILGLAFVTANVNGTADYQMLGLYPDPNFTQNVLRVLEDDFYELMSRPAITGVEIEYE